VSLNLPAEGVVLNFFGAGEPITHAAFAIRDQTLSPALVHVKRHVYCCLLRNTTILLHHFVNAISASLVGCYSRSPATLFDILLGMSEVCIADTRIPTSSIADVFTIVPTNNFHSWMNVNRWNDF
jgi:hypothetical protein